MRLDLTDRLVLVAGAARGIGAAIVAECLEAGARVLAVDIDPEGLDALAARHPERLETAALDLTDPTAVAELCEGRAVEVLIHAAGGVRGQRPKPIEDVSDADWSAIYDANVTAALNLVRLVVPGMKARERGRIITISSGAGLKPSLTGIQAYCSAKHALVGLTRQLALELGRFGITVNSVAPGFLRTSPDYERQWQGYSPEGQTRMLEGIAMRRLGKPEDIAAACLFLASDRAGFITGQVLPVSGHPFP
ncbi:SDR family NAD(P)-dependent oxidoreductase [Jannaschia sp. W003]|uniref:SDR family NAD(P)-dependent oxidoreductase n=1 Tax=Jannaschia sp. W003 TaxID=2867012 RepID=UPI0021A3D4CA|nr:SDR family NAD(P)-dependent oxidoreductase [Jannaschia sp. W003]UWQ22989.1 SDR family oxidoreductase [Jannaschia sp. W003]